MTVDKNLFHSINYREKHLELRFKKENGLQPGIREPPGGLEPPTC
jgi:hypothetical protein